MTPVVDIHNHAIPQGFVDRVRAEGARYGYRIEPTAEEGVEYITTSEGIGHDVPRRRIDEDIRQAELAAVGIDIAVESVSLTLANYGGGESQALWGAKALNEGYAENMHAYPDQVIAMAHVPLQYPFLAARELERVAEQHGIRSVQIATNVNGENLDDPKFYPFWDAAQSLGMLIFVHPSYVVARNRLARYHLKNLIGNPLETSIAVASLIFGGVLERYPRLAFVFAHSGGYAPWIRGRWRHGQQVRKEFRGPGALRPMDEYFSQLYFDSHIFDELALEFLVKSVGADHVLHGTDFPADMANPNQVGMIRGLKDVSDEDKDRILGANALRLLGRLP